MIPRTHPQARRFRDQPANVTADQQPSYIDVVSNLAEDTVLAGAIDVAAGDFTMAMFANPFTGGSEELLFLDEQRTLRWARHVNPVGGDDPGGLSGWRIDPLAGDTDQVLVVVHPDESIWAFSFSNGPQGASLALAQLVADAAVPGGCRWEWSPLPAVPRLPAPTGFLPIQYLSDRARTPVVFFDVKPDHELFYVLPSFPPAGAPIAEHWHAASFTYDGADRGAAKVASIDSANELDPYRPGVSMIHLWTQAADGERWLTDYEPRVEKLFRTRLASGPGAEWLGPWTHPQGGGAVLVAQGVNQTKVLCGVDYVGGPSSWSLMLDRQLRRMTTWQDSEGLLHIYGLDNDGTLRVIHQTGWANSSLMPGGALLEPVWETHPDDGTVVGTTRPLVASTAAYAVDAYPDQMPDQLVQHAGSPAGETYAFYSQNIRTGLWHEERIRLVPEALPKPYLVPRYETTVTVKNSYGGPVGGCEIHLTADAPVDLEVDGSFYRTGTVNPVVLRTDARGQATLRVVARGLNVPQLSVTVPGMGQSLTVQMASDVHRFLAGTDTLPNHPDGFTPQVVLDAKVPGGDDPLFPDVARGRTGKEARDVSWPPTAHDLVAWCQGAFAADAGTPLPLAMVEGLADGEQVCGFTIQTRDPGRPGFEVFGTADQVRAHREALHEQGVQGVVDELSTWFGDVWQAIGDGVADVVQATINLVDATVELVIRLADEVEALFVCAFDDVVSAAHAVEAAFVAVGAEIERVIDWLKWVFDFKDALQVAKQVYELVDRAPDLVKGVVTSLGTVVDDFFIDKEEQVRTWFDTLKDTLGDRSIGSFQGVTANVPVDAQPNPQTTSATDQLQGPHTNWFTDKVFGSTGSGQATVAREPHEDDPIASIFDDFIEIFDEATNMPELTEALSDLAELFWNLFSGKDADSVLATELVTLLDLVESVIIWVLKLLDDLVNGALTWAKDSIDAVVSILSESLDDVPLISTLWDFIVEQAGLDPEDYPLTIGMVGAFFLTYPFTIMWKIVAGTQPFPDGIPLPPKPSEVTGELGDAVLSQGLLAFQAFQGLMQTADFYLDMVFNNYVLSGQQPQLKPSGTLLKVFCAGHFFAYVIGDHPWFWGYPAPSKSHRVLPYVRYGPTFVLNMIDLASAFKFETVSELFEASADDPDKERKEAIFATFCFLAGWLRIGINIEEFRYLSDPSTGDDYDPAAPTWFDWWNLWINLTAYIQTATGFIRYLGQNPFETDGLDEIIWGALGVKNVVDILGDVFSGVCTVIQPARVFFAPTEIQDKPDTAWGLGDTTLYEPFVGTEIVRVQGGWPLYSWAALDPDDTSQDNWLPRGLRLERLEGTPGWVGDTVRLVGIPLEQVDYAHSRFTLQVTDSYGPPSIDTADASLTVAPAPDGVAMVTFTCSTTSGAFPLAVTFTNTTTDPFTEVHWDFGDGQTSADPDPTVTYQWAGSFTVSLACKNAAGWGANGQTISVAAS
jgi:hypothetical protein